MSDTTAAPQPVENVAERTLGQEVVRETTINFAAAAAGVAGVVGSLVVFSTLSDRLKARRARKNVVTENTEVPETTA